MSFKVSDKTNNLIISKNEIIKDKRPVVNTVQKSLELNLIPVTQDYKSKTDFSKLLKDPKIVDSQIDFSVESDINPNEESVEEPTFISKTINTVKDESTLSIASCVLSAVKIPQVEPIKLAVNILTSENKRQNLATDLEADNYSGIVNNSVSFAKSSLSSVIGISKLAASGTNVIADLGILSKTGKFATRINTVSGGAVSFASKVAVPFAILGTGMSASSIKTENNKVKMKKVQIEALNIAVAKSKNPNSVNANKAKQQLNSELKTLKVNTGLKSVSFGLSAISTATLIASVKNPAKAKNYATVSLATGIASSLTSVVADDKFRYKLSKLFNK